MIFISFKIFFIFGELFIICVFSFVVIVCLEVVFFFSIFFKCIDNLFMLELWLLLSILLIVKCFVLYKLLIWVIVFFIIERRIIILVYFFIRDFGGIRFSLLFLLFIFLL